MGASFRSTRRLHRLTTVVAVLEAGLAIWLSVGTARFIVIGTAMAVLVASLVQVLRLRTRAAENGA